MKFNLVGDHMVNIIHSRDGSHNTTDIWCKQHSQSQLKTLGGKRLDDPWNARTTSQLLVNFHFFSLFISHSEHVQIVYSQMLIKELFNILFFSNLCTSSQDNYAACDKHTQVSDSSLRHSKKSLILWGMRYLPKLNTTVYQGELQLES